jgi:ABC-type transport system substrate-binding protein
MRYIFLEFNLTAPPTNDVRVRRAINHAIDVESIIKVLFRDRAYGRFKGFIHEGFEGYQGDQLKPFTYDPDLAKKLLAEAGYPNGMDLEFWHVIGRYQLDKEASEAIAGQLGKVGIRVKLTGMESGAYFRKLSTEKVPGMNYIGCAPTFNHPISCPLTYFSSTSPLGYGATPQTDDYIKRISAELNEAKRVQLLRAFENYISNDLVPWVWLWYQQDLYGASNKLNWKPRSDEFISFEKASFR